LLLPQIGLDLPRYPPRHSDRSVTASVDLGMRPAKRLGVAWISQVVGLCVRCPVCRLSM